MLLQHPNIIYWYLSTWVLRRMTKFSLFNLICTCVMIYSYSIHFHIFVFPTIRFSHVLLDLPSGHFFDIPIFMLSKGSHRRQCLVFTQNCNFNVACPPFSDSAFRHEETCFFWFLPHFFLPKTLQKFYLYCLQSAQHRNSRITNLHSSKHRHTHTVHVVPLPTYYSHIFSKLIWKAKLLQLLLLSLVRNIHEPESHSNLATSRIYLHAAKGWNFMATPPPKKKLGNNAKAYYGE